MHQLFSENLLLKRFLCVSLIREVIIMFYFLNTLSSQNLYPISADLNCFMKKKNEGILKVL